MSINAMKQALEALENIDRWLPTIGQRGLRDYEFDAICALRQAIQEEALRNVARLGQEIEQEPVCPYCHDSHTLGAVYYDQNCVGCVRRMTATPQPQREYPQAERAAWIGLTLEDKQEFMAQDFGGSRLDAMDWAEKRLKEKNT
jgi:hypothetical protein